MDDSRRRVTLMALNTLPLAALTPWALARFRGPEAPPPGGSPAEAIARRFPRVTLTTQQGRRVRFYEDLVKGKKVLINFMYTECAESCPRTTANLVAVQKAFGDRVGRDVFFVSITLTPLRDTPARLAAYAKEQGCGPGWHFLTGDMEDINRVRRSLGVYDTADITQHVGIVTYGNETEGKWGATSALAPPDRIAWAVRNRVDGWVAQAWPARTS
jgi:protein SCO1